MLNMTFKFYLRFWLLFVCSSMLKQTCLLRVCVQEKAMGNRPSEMMDREKAYIPELQISFMEHIAMPIYKWEKHALAHARCLIADVRSKVSVISLGSCRKSSRDRRSCTSVWPPTASSGPKSRTSSPSAGCLATTHWTFWTRSSSCCSLRERSATTPIAWTAASTISDVTGGAKVTGGSLRQGSGVMFSCCRRDGCWRSAEWLTAEVF